MSYKKHAFNMTWLTEFLKIYLLINYCKIRHLILLKVQNMTDINADLLEWFTDFYQTEINLSVTQTKEQELFLA